VEAAGEISQTADAGQNEVVVGQGYTPQLTFTGSGMPISPVYAGSGFVFNKYNASRSIHFRNGIHASKPALPRPIAYGSDYSAQHRGSTGVVRVEKNMEAVGPAPVDPMQNFAPQQFKESSVSENITPQEENAVNKEYKNAGRRAYKSENRGNTETRRNNPIKAD
jgi:hypothetical protein